MKTTVELPDELYRRAKSEAALSGQKLKDLVATGLKLVLERTHTPKSPTMTELLRGAKGVANCGIADLATSARHMEGFGDARRHR